LIFVKFRASPADHPWPLMVDPRTISPTSQNLTPLDGLRRYA
jgi:hypothetical protein